MINQKIRERIRSYFDHNNLDIFGKGNPVNILNSGF